MVIDFKKEYGKTPLVLVVDDIQKNLQILGNMLSFAGYDVSTASNGSEALEIINNEALPDLILLDIMMPGMDGYAVCDKLKSNDRTRSIPIIFLTAKSETEDIVNAFNAGGIDFIMKPFNQEELKVRIRTHLELKFAKELSDKRSRELSETNKKLILSEKKLKESYKEKDLYLSIIASELSKAAEYIMSLLPPPLENGDIKIKWYFVPSAQLGGDSFGYHWIDDDNLAIYLLDVCGHGIGSALHSVSALNTIMFQTLPNTDFKSPEQVCFALNNAYQMAEHNEMFFTLWYGIYNKHTGILRYCGAGHPPALLMTKEREILELETRNLVIGGLPDIEYECNTLKIPRKSKLYVFSDGAFEIKMADGKHWTTDEMMEFLKDHANANSDEVEELYNFITILHENKNLIDDYSILALSFM